MEAGPRRGGQSPKNRGRAATWPRRGQRDVGVKRDWFKAVNRDSVAAVANLESEKCRGGVQDMVRTLIGGG